MEIAHEALIRCSPRLGEWLAEDRDGIRVHPQLTEAVAAWETLDHDAGSLYRGTRLSVALEWAHRDPSALTPRERAFLDASSAGRGTPAARRTTPSAPDPVVTHRTHPAGGAGAPYHRPDGRTVALGGTEGTTALWDVTDRADRAAFTGHVGQVNAVAVSPDGRLLATAGDDGSVILWDLATQTRWARLTGHMGPISSMAWSPDGTALATGSHDQTVTLWQIDAEDAVERLCAVLARDFPASVNPPPAACTGPQR